MHDNGEKLYGTVNEGPSWWIGLAFLTLGLLIMGGMGYGVSLLVGMLKFVFHGIF